MFRYAVDLGRFDMDCDVRSRARMLAAIGLEWNWKDKPPKESRPSLDASPQPPSLIDTDVSDLSPASGAAGGNDGGAGGEAGGAKEFTHRYRLPDGISGKRFCCSGSTSLLIL